MPSAPCLLLHTSRIPVRWGDQDAFGHVNNTLYFRYFEQARIEALLAACGDAWPDDGGLPILAATSAEFLRPIHAPATVVVQVYGGPPGRTSFVHFYELRLEGEGDALYATCEARLVWVDLRAARPRSPTPFGRSSHPLTEPWPTPSPPLPTSWVRSLASPTGLP